MIRVAKIDEFKHRELTAKIDMIIEFLKERCGIGHEIYSFICAASHEEVSIDIVDVALDIKNEIDILSRDNDYFPF